MGIDHSSVSGIERMEQVTDNGVRFQRVLVAIDFSEQSAQALKLAVSIAQEFRAELHLVHAATPFVYETASEGIPIEVLHANLEAAKVQMARWISEEAGLSALAPKTTVVYAGAVDLIEQLAKEQRADLIVAGSHGARGLERLALGSVAEAVLRRVACPVLIVGPHCKAVDHPFRTMVLASSMTSSERRAAQYAAALTEQFHGTLTLLHVLAAKSSDPQVQPELIAAHLERELERLLPSNVGHACATKVRVEYGVAGKVIASVAREEGAGLVVVGMRERATLADHAWWSTLSEIVREAECGVLSIRGR